MATLAKNIQRAIDDFNTIENAIVQKGVPVPDGTPTSEYGEKILSIESGVDTSGDTVVPSALREGYTAHNAAGQEITGAIPDYSGGNTVEMTSPEGATLNTAGTYCEGNIEVVPKLQSKTATTGEIVTADDGYVGLESVDTNPAFEAGKKSEYDAFWDAYQDYGNRRSYSIAFARADSGLARGSGWPDSILRPKYDLICEFNTNGMFQYNDSTNIKRALESAGVVLDTSRANGEFVQMFQGCKSEELPFVDASGAKSLSHAFSFCGKLIALHIKVSENTPYSNTFSYSSKITTLTIEGTIGKNGLNLSWSPLDKESITSLVNALSSTTMGLTVTLRLAAVNTAFETSAGAADGSTSEEWTALIATKPNWTINLINS